MLKKRFSRTLSLTETMNLYCPGCGHGIAHRIVAEAIDRLGVREKTIGVAPVGCAVFAYDYWNFDVTEAAHGRPPAVATGIKRVLPDRIVFTYQGDGDLASIGTAEIVHAAARNENITVIFINNAVFGMTQGQMAPTTLTGQKTATKPGGRDPVSSGFPLNVCELLAAVPGSRYIERVALNTPAGVLRGEAAVRKAFENQIAGIGFSLVEMLSMCPTNWGKDEIQSLGFIDEMAKQFPTGVFKDEK